MSMKTSLFIITEVSTEFIITEVSSACHLAILSKINPKIKWVFPITVVYNIKSLIKSPANFSVILFTDKQTNKQPDRHWRLDCFLGGGNYASLYSAVRRCHISQCVWTACPRPLGSNVSNNLSSRESKLWRLDASQMPSSSSTAQQRIVSCYRVRK